MDFEDAKSLPLLIFTIVLSAGLIVGGATYLDKPSEKECFELTQDKACFSSLRGGR